MTSSEKEKLITDYWGNLLRKYSKEELDSVPLSQSSRNFLANIGLPIMRKYPPASTEISDLSIEIVSVLSMQFGRYFAQDLRVVGVDGIDYVILSNGNTRHLEVGNAFVVEPTNDSVYYLGLKQTKSKNWTNTKIYVAPSIQDFLTLCTICDRCFEYSGFLLAKEAMRQGYSGPTENNHWPYYEDVFSPSWVILDYLNIAKEMMKLGDDFVETIKYEGSFWYSIFPNEKFDDYTYRHQYIYDAVRRNKVLRRELKEDKKAGKNTFVYHLYFARKYDDIIRNMDFQDKNIDLDLYNKLEELNKDTPEPMVTDWEGWYDSIEGNQNEEN